ncbi:NnrU family protein [Balneatrix alpica]|uniref:NnrU family protein n=1 Tax=Balneatrix alpica TaxID=75684 RepID=A0ABV5ZEY6_9GAMM|nr:NnrU family protein [Balneatrix alpica]
MSWLVLGLGLFFAIHLLPILAPAGREQLRLRLGAQGYRGSFALLAAIGLGLMIYGKSQAPFINLWLPPLWGQHLTMLLMLLALISLVTMWLPSNLRRLSPHPLLWSVTLWGLAHLASNGDLASVLLFGSFVLYAQVARLSQNRRGAQASVRRCGLWRELVVLGVACLAYGALLWGHGYFAGIPLIALS